MKIKQTYKTAAITAFFLAIWMVSGSLVDDEVSPKSESSLATLSSVTVLNSQAILKSKSIRASGFTEADKFINVRAEIGGRVVSTPFKQGDYVKEIKVDNKDRTIRDGVSAEIFIESKKVFSHKISPAILSLNDQGKLGIRTVDENNSVEFREIEILEDTTDGLWISGLNENERIITLGQEYVFQGQTVNVKEISYPEA